MTSLYVWKATETTVCRVHKTASDWDYEPLSANETRELVRMLQAEDLASVLQSDFATCGDVRIRPEACGFRSPGATARW